MIQFQALESRRLLSSDIIITDPGPIIPVIVPVVTLPQVSVRLNNGTLTVTGDETNNELSFVRHDRLLDVVQAFAGQDEVLATFAYRHVKRIVAYGKGGADRIVVGPKDIPSNLIGGPGNDTLSGSAANDVLNGGRGDDFLSGGAGVDTLIGGRGDGNDTVNGGPGRDTLIGGAGDDTRQISVDRDDAADLFEHFDDLRLSTLPFTLGDSQISTRIRTENGRTTLRVSVVVSDSGYSVDFGSLSTNSDGSLDILLSGTQVGANAGVLPVVITQKSYYDLSGLSPGLHTLHIRQPSGLIRTVEFQQ